MGDRIIQKKADYFKALSHPTRIKILELLREGELCVCDILEELKLEQSNVSQHLAILRKQGILN
ncbi:MAG: ArsR family transcriptional regulator, partial [Candidatus Syntrophonatronum acetioxidans]